MSSRGLFNEGVEAYVGFLVCLRRLANGKTRWGEELRVVILDR
jgi:hypothetical protein